MGGRLVLAVLAALILAGVPALATSLITNGSFENPGGTGIFDTIHATDSTSITGWTVSAGSVDYIHTYWTAEDGSSSLDMEGLSPGTIFQNVNLVAGVEYVLTFWMSGNPDGGPWPKTLQVSVGGASENFDYAYNGHTLTNMMWVEHSMTFTAAVTGSTPVQFEDVTAEGTAYGAALDNVSLDPVPEPGTFLLFGIPAMMLPMIRPRRQA